MPFTSTCAPTSDAVVDEQADAPRVDDDVALDAALGDRLLEQRDALRERQQRRLAGVVRDDHVQPVEERRRAADDVEMPQGHRVEGTGDDGDAGHDALRLPADPVSSCPGTRGASSSLLRSIAAGAPDTPRGDGSASSSARRPRRARPR